MPLRSWCLWSFICADGHGVCILNHSAVRALTRKASNKWVLNTTTTPLFFLWAQLAIAALLFMASDALRLLPDRLTFNVETCRGLIPMVGLNVVGLRYAHAPLFSGIADTPAHSFSNYTLKYVDASFYQVARGLILPFTVCTSLLVLHARPSLRILLCCALVTLGFFVGVFLDGTPLSLIGVGFGVASSAITAVHSVVIKQSLSVVGGSALALSWYTNLLSAVVLLPLLLLAGEGKDVAKLFLGVGELVQLEGAMTPLATFLWGSLITVSDARGGLVGP
jgi:GDP-fucose transporter C1